MASEILEEHEQLGIVWDYYKPRHTHSWNMLQISARHLHETNDSEDFETEYAWENLIIRLWLYRNTNLTLCKLTPVKSDAKKAIKRFDQEFLDLGGKNKLKAIRDMFEHFDEYAAGVGRGPAERHVDLDPWRTITVATYSRGKYTLDFVSSMDAATRLRDGAKLVSTKFIDWYKLKKVSTNA